MGKGEIKFLDDYNEYSEDSAKVKEVTELGLKYNLLTAYTSFIAVDKTEVVDKNGKQTTVEQPLPLPENVSNYAVGADVGIDDEIADKNNAEMSVYSEITINTGLDSDKEKNILANIENKISASIKTYLLSVDDIDFDSITVNIDNTGNIKNIEVNGKAVSGNSKEAIKKIIVSWEFASLGINKEWQFTIKF